jgi:DNA adenine methylase
MFFSVGPQRALLGDLNGELISVYQQVTRNGRKIEEALAKLPVTRKTYQRVRRESPNKVFDRTVRFIYLNRTCYGGLHRTNLKGEFNVPYGGGDRTPEPVYRDHLLLKAARLLRKADVRLEVVDFAELIAKARKGDVVFCDPTYRSAGRGRFDRYGPVVFSWDDQKRLAQASKGARDRGAVVIVMNIDDHDVVDLYKDAMLVPVSKTKAIGNKSTDHAQDREIMAVFDPLNRDLWRSVSKASDVTRGNGIRRGVRSTAAVA